MDRAAASAHLDAEDVTVELAVSADGRLVPTPRRVGDTTPYVDIKVTLRRVDPLEPLRRLLPEGRAHSSGRPPNGGASGQDHGVSQ